VLKGDMSLVGPRPLIMRYLPRYTSEQARRHEVRPGITGLAQITGRHTLPWDERFRLDVWYVDHWSLRRDLRIGLSTIRIALQGSGTLDSEAADFEFMGTEGDGYDDQPTRPGSPPPAD
jgi:sugar transferase EpsL